MVEMDVRLSDWVEASWLLGSLDGKFDNCGHTLLVACAVPPTFDAIVTASSEEDGLINTEHRNQAQWLSETPSEINQVV